MGRRGLDIAVVLHVSIMGQDVSLGVEFVRDVLLDRDEGTVQEHVEDSREDEEDYHQSQRSGCERAAGGSDGKEANETDLGQINTGGELLDGFGERAALGIGLVRVLAVNHVVAEGDVQQTKTNSSKAEDQGSNARVDNNCKKIS